MNYKTKILFILLAGFLIVSLITIISMYSVYQYKHIQLLSSSSKIIQLYKNTFKHILEDAEYFKRIDFSQSSKKILSDFKKTSITMYHYNNNINAISLIKQFPNLDYEKVYEESIITYTGEKLNIRPIQKIIKDSKKSQSNFLSIIMHSEPVAQTNKSIGIELASEENRYQTILNMHKANEYTISRPAQLVHKYKEKVSNSIIFYPLYKKKRDEFYTWFVAMPFTYNKILDNIVSKDSSFSNLYIEVFDKNENIIAGTKGAYINGSMVLVLEREVNLGSKEYRIQVFAKSIFTFDRFLPNIFGFFSGLLFLIFIGYYLIYKENKNKEILGLKFRLSEAQNISSSGHCVCQNFSDTFLCSDGFRNILKIDDSIITLRKLLSIIYIEDKKNVYHHIVNVAKKKIMKNGNLTVRVLTNDRMKWVKVEYRTFYDEKNNIHELFIVIQDITSFKTLEIALKESNEKFQEIARIDHLTGAYNRAYFDKELERELNLFSRYGNIFTILLIDIDHFKKINDTYGHNVGDSILIEFSQRIENESRDTDIFARWGGEEFVILLPNIDNAHAAFVADKIRKSINETLFSSIYNITCSIGVSEVKKYDSALSLFTRVDKALYDAKENGRNRIKVY